MTSITASASSKRIQTKCMAFADVWVRFMDMFMNISSLTVVLKILVEEYIQMGHITSANSKTATSMASANLCMPMELLNMASLRRINTSAALRCDKPKFLILKK